MLIIMPGGTAFFHTTGEKSGLGPGQISAVLHREGAGVPVVSDFRNQV
jgi:hypothetical protein